eukprot:8448452-Pyramimonas_sp.AAC.1
MSIIRRRGCIVDMSVVRAGCQRSFAGRDVGLHPVNTLLHATHIIVSVVGSLGIPVQPLP